MEWTSVDTDSTVLDRISAAISDPSLVEESVRALLSAPQDPDAGYGVVAASAFYKQVQLSLEIHSTKPTLDSVELLRISGSGSMPSALASSVWSALELSYVRRVRCSVGTAWLLEQEALARLSSLRVLNLSHCEMTALPGMVGLLQVGRGGTGLPAHRWCGLWWCAGGGSSVSSLECTGQWRRGKF